MKKLTKKEIKISALGLAEDKKAKNKEGVGKFNR